MATEEKKFIVTINPERKTITIDDSVKETERDKKQIEMYLSVGYIIRYQSEKRIKNGKKNSLVKDDIIKALENDKEALAFFEKLCTAKNKQAGYFVAKSWYDIATKENNYKWFDGDISDIKDAIKKRREAEKEAEAK